MRDIIFRGKREDNGEWITESETYIKDGDGTWLCDESNDVVKVLPETVGQFTGLTDKNGVRIFEGDIMRNAGNVVGFCGGNFCINGDSPLSYWTGTEVIGNIHDKPELLEGGTQ